jgi:hypothetical protein
MGGEEDTGSEPDRSVRAIPSQAISSHINHLAFLSKSSVALLSTIG